MGAIAQLNLLTDTHALLWWVTGNSRLSAAAYAAIDDSDNVVFVSAASAWEIATKHRLGRLPEADDIAQDIKGRMTEEGFRELVITLEDGEYAGRLFGHHQDPFDRIIIAQALIRNLTIVSNERIFDQYGINRIW